MQILAILWQPNAAWCALNEAEQLEFLKGIDGHIAAGRAEGLVVLGWSAVDRSIRKAPAQGFVGVFGVAGPEAVKALEANVAASGWYDYFDSVNVSIALEGATSSEPHRIYAKLLGVPT